MEKIEFLNVRQKFFALYYTVSNNSFHTIAFQHSLACIQDICTTVVATV